MNLWTRYTENPANRPCVPGKKDRKARESKAAKTVGFFQVDNSKKGQR